MSETIKIRRNALFSLSSSFVRITVNFLIFWFIARKFGPENFGQFTLAHTLATILILFADFGLDVLLTTELARDNSNSQRYFQQFLSIKILFSIMALVFMWIFAFVGNLSHEARLLIFIFSFYMIFTTLTNFLFALYKGFERLEYEAIVTLVINISLLIAIVILIIFNADILVISLIFVGSRVAGFFIGCYYSYKVFPNIRYSLFFEDFKGVRKKIFIFGFHLLFNNLYFQLDTILIAFWKDDFSVGIYQSAFKLFMLPLILPDILTNTLMPTLSRLNAVNIFQWKKTGYLMNKILGIVVIPISMIFFIYADQIISLLYGENQFIEAIPLLKIFSFTLLIRFTFETYSLMLTTSNRQDIRMKVVIIATALNFILNSFMIPKYGVYGAAFVSLITITFIGVTYSIKTFPLFLEWIINYKNFVIYALAFGIGCIMWICKSAGVFIGAPLVLFLFFIIAYYYFFSPEEKKVIFSLDFGFSFNKKNNTYNQ